MACAALPLFRTLLTFGCCCAEHAANLAHKAVGNQQLSLLDALLTYGHPKDAAQDRVYQVVLKSAPELPHRAVHTAFKTLVELCHQAHHEVLREVTLQYPETVFINDTQRRVFDALCELIELPVLPTLPAAAAAAGAAAGASAGVAAD